MPSTHTAEPHTSTTATAPSSQTAPASGRPAATIIAAILAALALAALVAGVALGLLHTTKPDDDGFYTSGAETLSTPTHALVSDGIDVSADGAEALLRDGGLGTIRVTATTTNAKPVFLGIAPTAQVDAYLAGVSRDDVTDFEVDPFSVQTSRHRGTATPAPPAQQKFWTRTATGSGTRTLTWPAQDGSWDVVVMNADGSSGVRTELAVAARFPLMGWIAGGLLAIGTFLGIGAAAVLVAGRRGR